MTHGYTHEFQCIYQLGRYPFDTQVVITKLPSLFPQECSIEMNVLSSDQKSVTLTPYHLTMNQTLDMTRFLITGYVFENSKNAKGGIIMTITMKRKILSEMMPTYFPSLLLMMITFATTFFKPIFFEASLSVNLTTMLVMTTIFISKMEGLPPTSDIKMIDIWLILCQLVPFEQVVLFTAMEYFGEQGQHKNEKQDNRKRKREKKRKAKEKEEEKQKNIADGRQNTTRAKNTIEGDLQLVIEKEDAIEKDHSLEAWTHNRSNGQGKKYGLVKKNS